MATEGGKQGFDLKMEGIQRLLLEEPSSVRFFQAVRLLERLYPDRNPVGLFVTPGSEIVRFSSNPSLTFPPSEIHSLTQTSSGQTRVSVNFMGLSAAVGALPHPYTEFLLERNRAKDYAPGEFFDLFNHRIVSLFYRAWQKHRFYIAYERDRKDEDAITARLFDLLGLGTSGLKNRMEIADDASIYYSGLLGQQTRTVQGLKGILEDYFGIQVSIDEFTGTWNRLPANNLTYLHGRQSLSEQLGMGTIVGDEVWDQQGTVTIRLGPMNFDQYQEFLPGASAYLALRSWLRFYANREFDFVVQLVLEREHTPGMKLGEEGPRSSKLGLVSWLKNRSLERDPDEATYRIE